MIGGAGEPRVASSPLKSNSSQGENCLVTEDCQRGAFGLAKNVTMTLVVEFSVLFCSSSWLRWLPFATIFSRNTSLETVEPVLEEHIFASRLKWSMKVLEEFSPSNISLVGLVA